MNLRQSYLPRFFILSLLLALAITGCKEGPVGPVGEQGVAGPRGPQGPQGPAGNANISYYAFNTNLASYFHDSNHEVWGVKADVPPIRANEMVSVFVWINVFDNDYEWTALPFNHHWNGSQYFNQFVYSIDDSGNLWLYIRNSAGSQPYTSMSGNIGYKVFVATADGLDACASDMNDYESLMNCIEADYK